jgi:hypothetical protein
VEQLVKVFEHIQDRIVYPVEESMEAMEDEVTRSLCGEYFDGQEPGSSDTTQPNVGVPQHRSAASDLPDDSADLLHSDVEREREKR